MKRKLKSVASDALELDARSRAALAKQLLESLDDLSEEEKERLWAEEAERRYSEFKAGRSEATNGLQVLARARSRSR